jgi:Rrf2 family protein
MFKISTKGDYGLLLMQALAECDNEEFVSLKKVADEKQLSSSYLSQIVIPLKEAGLVESKEGLRGGYRLTKPSEKITMLEILEALEGKIAPTKCIEEDDCSGCKCSDGCNVKNTWREATDMLHHFLSSRTLRDLSKKTTSNTILFTS